MRKLVVSMFTRVDGFINGRNGMLIGPAWSRALDGWTSEMVERFDTLLYGRRTRTVGDPHGRVDECWRGGWISARS